MVALNTAYAPSETRTQPKNRVGNFFGRSGDRVGQNRPATRNRIGEKRPILTIIASGRPVWPSRDPIGEFGSVLLSYDFSYDTIVKLLLDTDKTVILNFENNIFSGIFISDEHIDRLVRATYRVEFYSDYLAPQKIGISAGSINEELNLFSFINNTSINQIDLLGLINAIPGVSGPGPGLPDPGPIPPGLGDWLLNMLPYFGPQVPDPVGSGDAAAGTLEIGQLIALRRALARCQSDPPPCDPDCTQAAEALAEAQRQYNQRNR